jgi:hypothetical protein
VAVVNALQQLSCKKAPAAVTAGDGAASPAPATDSKIQENLTRIAVDVLVQIILDTDNFASPVRQAASAALGEIAQSCFKTLTTKLLHLISDDREPDDAAQVAAERKYALESISQLVTTPKYKLSWTEELQKSLLTFAALVFRTATAQELEQLSKIICELPHVKDSHGAPLLEAFLLKAAFDTPRSLESLLLVTRSLPRTLVFPQLGTKFIELKLVAKAAESSAELAVGLSKGLTVAARMADGDVAEKLLPDVLDGLEKLLDGSSSVAANYSQLEAFLLAAAILGSKRGTALSAKLRNEPFADKLKTVKAALGDLLPTLTYGIKKRVGLGTAGAQDAEALECIKNILTMVGIFADKKLPSATLTLSWEKKNALPAIKRAREEAPGAGAAAQPAQKEKRVEVYRPKGKQQQQQQQQQQGNRRR